MLSSTGFILRQRAYFFIAILLAAFLLVIGGEWLRIQQSVAQTPHQIFYVAPNGSDTHEGSITHPWATVNHAADVLKAGETVYIRAGIYTLEQQIQAKHSGTADAWITYSAFPGEPVIIDAKAIAVASPSGTPPFAHDQGAFQLENVAYIKVKNLEIINSHNSSITVRNSQYIDLYNNKTENTFSPGIGIWESTHQKVMGNTVVNANAPEMAGYPHDLSETPHEAISLGTVENFEVAYNLVQYGQKEGIDIKGKSQHGTVHHNYVHHMERQGLYVDGWSGLLEDVEVFNNVVHDCQGAGFVVSVEGKSAAAKNIRFHHNLLYENWGTGILLSKWGNDGLREDVKIDHNTVHHNGYGPPNPGDKFYWITGGLYLFSDNLQSIAIKNNIFSENNGFQIGYSDSYLKNSSKIEEVFQQKQIDISHNLVSGVNNAKNPIYAGWPPDNYANIYGTNGNYALADNPPQFINAKFGNFYLESAPTIDKTRPIGAFPYGEKPDLWWHTTEFPPKFSESSDFRF
ncbi:MAG: right-handed parallel beta-helix repeat-containing protein [Symploca sp. SIO1C2]|nr:right-handed parallel beta-helix repeat-containing protein [Symploca sp. SIO1C2]